METQMVMVRIYIVKPFVKWKLVISDIILDEQNLTHCVNTYGFLVNSWDHHFDAANFYYCNNFLVVQSPNSSKGYIKLQLSVSKEY